VINETGPSAEQTLTTLKSVSYRAGELQDYLDSVCEVLLHLLGDGISAITLYRDGVKQVLARRPEVGESTATMDVHGHLSTYVVNHNTVLKVEDAENEKGYGNAPEGYCSYLGIPLRIPSGEVVGTLCYFNRAKRQYSASEQQTAELFAERVAIALDNYQLYKQLEQHSGSLETLVQERTEQLLAARDQLAHKEKLAAVGEFAAQITHEIRNPLTTIGLTLEYLQKHPEKNAAKRIELAAGEVGRLERMLEQVLLYARPARVILLTLELSAFIKDIVATYDSLARERDQQLVVAVDTAVTVQADRDKLTQVVLNLIRNACEAAEPGHTITISSAVAQEWGTISVHNFGMTIPENKLAHITEPFVSAKPGGSGLGLAITSSLLEAMGGRLELVSTQSDGTTATLYLPRSIT
jgi:signal transduction histidine kinase